MYESPIRASRGQSKLIEGFNAHIPTYLDLMAQHETRAAQTGHTLRWMAMFLTIIALVCLPLIYAGFSIGHLLTGICVISIPLSVFLWCITFHMHKESTRAKTEVVTHWVEKAMESAFPEIVITEEEVNEANLRDTKRIEALTVRYDSLLPAMTSLDPQQQVEKYNGMRQQLACRLKDEAVERVQKRQLDDFPTHIVQHIAFSVEVRKLSDNICDCASPLRRYNLAS